MDRLFFADAPVIDGWTLRLSGADPQTFDADTGYADSYAATIAHFVEALREDRPFETPAGQGLEMLEKIERVYALAGEVCAAPS